jgi:transcriptional regulator with XRE-family HTH domain
MYNNRLKALREDTDLNQKDFAALFHISQRAYSHYEKGDRSIPLEILCRIAEYYNTSTDYILYRTDERKPYTPKKK